MTQKNATTLNLSMLAEHNARQRPEKTAIVYGESRLTFKQLNDYANKVANALLSLGLQAGDHVALSCPNITYFPIVYYGILKAGCVVVPLNILCKPREVAYHLQDSDAKAVFVFEGTPELPLGQIVKAGFDEATNCEHLIVISSNPMSATSSIEGAQTLTQLIANASDKFETCATAPDDTAVILYTSGTTGRPKGAELTHLNMLMNANVSRDLYTVMLDNSSTADNRILITLPLFHSTAQTCQLNAAMYGGIASVLLPRFDAKTVIETMKKERINLWTAVPTMFWALIKYVEENDVDVSLIKDNLRVCSSGGAPMPVEVLMGFQEMFGVKVLEGYGLSETAPVSSFNQPERPQKPGTVGTPLFNVEIKCFDENDVEVPTGHRGEVVMRGHNVMKGYYKKPEATAEALRSGWFHSGDIGVFDEDGYLSIVDRKKDMILRGGYNVYPRELEETIITHPEVSLVAVIGVTDERLGEEVKAFIVRKQGATVTEAEMLAWLKENIATNKYPRHVEFREELPISATGKILKRELPRTV
ncbi:MAG: long-chain fatty acid--CoA ligase [Pyrinomonadaceae bacterium]|nr:long-chain fatty acid--CoA ligase [Pyrinomonadaceae bacterium]